MRHCESVNQPYQPSKNSQKSSFPRKRESIGSYYNSAYNIHNIVCVTIFPILRQAGTADEGLWQSLVLS